MTAKLADEGLGGKAARPMDLALVEAERARELGEVPIGAVEHGPRLFAQATCHHAPEVIGGIGEVRAASLLREFFAKRR